MSSFKIFGLLSVLVLSGCSATYQQVTDMSEFYKDKLSCETTYTQGYGLFGSKSYGDIGQKGPAQDCMLSKGYRFAQQ